MTTTRARARAMPALAAAVRARATLHGNGTMSGAARDSMLRAPVAVLETTQQRSNAHPSHLILHRMCTHAQWMVMQPTAPHRDVQQLLNGHVQREAVTPSVGMCGVS